MVQILKVKLTKSLPKALVITGLAAESTGTALLYIYLCMSKKINKIRCTGIVCAVSWAFAALLDIIALETIRKVIVKPFERELMTPWAVIILGIGSCWALIVGFVVALTTCGKRFDKTVIIYRELKDKEGECLIKYNEDEDD